MQIPGPALDDVMRGLSSTPNVDGLRVTMPHKRAAFGHCATSWERATLLVVVIGYETRAIIASDVPHLRMIQAVATACRCCCWCSQRSTS